MKGRGRFVNSSLQSEEYTPEKLLDSVTKLVGVKNDAQLSKKINVAHPIISKIRNRKVGFSASVILAIHESTGLSLPVIRNLCGVEGKFGE